jgi:hypothetical protein
LCSANQTLHRTAGLAPTACELCNVALTARRSKRWLGYTEALIAEMAPRSMGRQLSAPRGTVIKPFLALCGSLPGCRDDYLDVDSCTGKHADKGIDAKEIDSPANEIADPWLRNTH